MSPAADSAKGLGEAGNQSEEAKESPLDSGRPHPDDDESELWRYGRIGFFLPSIVPLVDRDDYEKFKAIWSIESDHLRDDMWRQIKAEVHSLREVTGVVLDPTQHDVVDVGIQGTATPDERAHQPTDELPG